MQPAPHLHAPRPSLLAPPLSTLAALHYPESAPTHDSRSRLRGDGFLLDEDDDVADGAHAGGMPPEPHSGGGADSNESMSLVAPTTAHGPAPMDSVAAMPLGSHFLGDASSPTGLMQMRPRSADVTGAPFAATKITRGASESAATEAANAGIGGANPSALLCPSCGDQPPGAEHEGTFHAHITRCFITHHVGRPPRTPQATPLSHHNSMMDGGAGPIRKTRGRASSAAAATHGAAELASALASKENGAASMHTTPESHGYHPYNHSPHLSSTLTQLRRTVDQLDLHQRISIMEAFHKLSRVASAEQQQHASPMQPSPRGKRLRSATNSPSPKQLLSASDRVCKDILSLLYSPQSVRAPHPSPMPNAVFVGVPSPLVIGIASNAHAGAIKQRSAEMEAAAAAASGRPPVPSIMQSPIAGEGHMDEMRHLELEPTYQVRTPVKTSLLFSLNPPVPRRLDSASVDSSMSSPAMTDTDGCESDAAAGSALAMTGAFVHGISSGASSPASTPSGPCSEQTSPSAPTESTSSSSSAVYSTTSVPHPRFPAHCFPDSSVLRAPPPFPSSSASTSSSSSSSASSEISPEAVHDRTDSPHSSMHGSAVLPLPPLPMPDAKHTQQTDRSSPLQCMHDEVTDKQQQRMLIRRSAAARG